MVLGNFEKQLALYKAEIEPGNKIWHHLSNLLKNFYQKYTFQLTIFPLVTNLSLNMFKKCLIVSSRSKKMENIWCSSKEIL